MAHWYDRYEYGNVREHEYKFAGRYGKKGERRAKREKPTPEYMQLVNRLNKAKKTKREIGANFGEDDIFSTLTYEKGKRKSMAEVKKDFGKFIDSTRDEYKKRGYQLKWITTIEIGERGGIHIHLIVNRIPDADRILTKKWKHGHVNFKLLYQQGNYEQLGSYLAKVPEEDDEKHPEKKREERMAKITKENYYYSTSRNLIRPEPVVHKRYTRRTVEKIIREGPKPSEGYYIDRDSIRTGVSRLTGLSYLYYTEVRLENKNERKRRI